MGAEYGTDLRTYQDLELASLHEAGHSVAVVAQGGTVEIVNLDLCLEAEDSQLEPWAAAVACLAGGVAARNIGPKWRSKSRETSETDKANAVSHLLRIGMGPMNLHRVEEHAAELVRIEGWKIERVAQALRQGSGSLSGEQVARICAREPVATVLANPGTHATSLPAHSAPTSWGTTPTATGAPLRIRVETFKIGENGRPRFADATHGWCAAMLYPLPDSRLGNCKVQEAVADSKGTALAMLRERASKAVGAPVLLVEG